MLTGRHAIEAALRRGAGRRLLVSPRGRGDALVRLAVQRGIVVEEVAEAHLRTAAGSSARGLALELGRDASTVDLGEWLRGRSDGAMVAVAADHLNDPHNLGAIARSAYLFGARIIVLPSRRSVQVTDAARRASAGAIDGIAIAPVTNLRRALDQFRSAGWWVYGADAGGVTYTTIEWAPKSLIVLGGEGPGLSPGVRSGCDVIATIPIADGKELGVDSLNVSVAAALLIASYRAAYPSTQ